MTELMSIIPGVARGNCTQCMPGACNTVTGSCLECLPGYLGPRCNITCPYGSFGASCLGKCSRNCDGNGSCHSVNGACRQGCRSGFVGTFCNQTCQYRRYGHDCAKTCSAKCRDGLCDRSTGKCVQCRRGRAGPFCENEAKMRGAVSTKTMVIYLLGMVALGISMWAYIVCIIFVKSVLIHRASRLSGTPPPLWVRRKSLFRGMLAKLPKKRKIKVRENEDDSMLSRLLRKIDSDATITSAIGDPFENDNFDSIIVPSVTRSVVNKPRSYKTLTGHFNSKHTKPTAASVSSDKSSIADIVSLHSHNASSDFSFSKLKLKFEEGYRSSRLSSKTALNSSRKSKNSNIIYTNREEGNITPAFSVGNTEPHTEDEPNFTSLYNLDELETEEVSELSLPYSLFGEGGIGTSGSGTEWQHVLQKYQPLRQDEPTIQTTLMDDSFGLSRCDTTRDTENELHTRQTTASRTSAIGNKLKTANLTTGIQIDREPDTRRKKHFQKRVLEHEHPSGYSSSVTTIKREASSQYSRSPELKRRSKSLEDACSDHPPPQKAKRSKTSHRSGDSKCEQGMLPNRDTFIGGDFEKEERDDEIVFSLPRENTYLSDLGSHHKHAARIFIPKLNNAKDTKLNSTNSHLQRDYHQHPVSTIQFNSTRSQTRHDDYNTPVRPEASSISLDEMSSSSSTLTFTSSRFQGLSESSTTTSSTRPRNTRSKATPTSDTTRGNTSLSSSTTRSSSTLMNHNTESIFEQTYHQAHSSYDTDTSTSATIENSANKTVEENSENLIETMSGALWSGTDNYDEYYTQLAYYFAFRNQQNRRFLYNTENTSRNLPYTTSDGTTQIRHEVVDGNNPVVSKPKGLNFDNAADNNIIPSYPLHPARVVTWDNPVTHFLNPTDDTEEHCYTSGLKPEQKLLSKDGENKFKYEKEENEKGSTIGRFFSGRFLMSRFALWEKRKGEQSGGASGREGGGGGQV